MAKVGAEAQSQAIAPNDVKRLFAGGSIEERALDEHVSRLLHRIITAEDVTSSICYEDVASQFQATALPPDPRKPDEYMLHLGEHAISHTINTASPRFIGHMTTALPYFVRPLARLITTLNQNNVKVETSKAFTALERETLAMLHRHVFRRRPDFYRRHEQRYDSSLGIITSGGTTANMSALWVARNHALGPQGAFLGVAKEGMAAALAHHGYRRAVVVGSELMHYSFDKSADILGLGEDNLLRVPVERSGRIDIRQLHQRLMRCREEGSLVLALIGIAGSTESGTIDDLRAMADIAASTGIYFHVDAAWGGPIAFSATHSEKLAGIECADSVTIDGHKQMYLPMGIGAVMFKDAEKAAVIEKYARYIIRRGSPDLGRRSLEGSRAAMAVFLHAGLHLLGHSGYGALIDAGIDNAKYMAASIRRRPEFELLNPPESNIVNYRYVPPALRSRMHRGVLSVAENERINGFNECLQRIQLERGRTFTSRTAIAHTGYGRECPILVLRAVLANPLTEPAHIDAVLDEQLEIGAELSRSGTGLRRDRSRPT